MNWKHYENLMEKYLEIEALINAEESGFGYGVEADPELYRLQSLIARKLRRMSKALHLPTTDPMHCDYDYVDDDYFGHFCCYGC